MANKVKTGQPMRAADINAIVAQVNAQARIFGTSGTNATVTPAGTTLGRPAPSAFAQYGTYLQAQNTGDVAVERWRPATIYDVMFPATSQYFDSHVMLEIRQTDLLADSGRPWVIACEDIAINAWGRVCIMGLTPAYIYRPTGCETFQQVECMCKVGYSTTLEVRRDGTAQIIWDGVDGLGNNVALIRMHNSNAWAITDLDVVPGMDIQNNSLWCKTGGTPSRPRLWWRRADGVDVLLTPDP